MAGWRRMAINARACLLLAFAIGAFASVAQITDVTAQQPDGQTDDQKPPAPPTTDLLEAGRLYRSLSVGLNAASKLPCIRQDVLDRLLKEFAQLEDYANAQGDKFIAGGDQGDLTTSVMATKWADQLQPWMTFVKTMPICSGPMPWDPPPPGGGGVTDGPNGGWPQGIIPPSRTQIPDCFDAQAQDMLDMLDAKIPEEEKKQVPIKAEMDRLRKEIIDLATGQARAKAKGEQPDPNAQSQIEHDQAQYGGLAFQLRSIEIQETMDKEDQQKLEWLKKNKPCPKEHSMYVPGTGSGEQYVTYASDSTTHCTYTDATFTTTLVTSFTDGPPSDVPTPTSPQPSSPRPSDKPQTAMVPDRPIKPVDKPTTPSTPTPTTETTPAAPDDTPSDIPDNVELKVTQEVLEGGQTGGPLEGQTIKLLLTEKSDLPVPVDPKATLVNRRADVSFDRPPNQCTTDASGTCKIQVSSQDRAAYRLASPKKGEQRTYHLDIARPQTSGGVTEIVPGKEKIDPKALQSMGSKIVTSTFKIGNRTFMRFALATKYGIDAPLASRLKEAYGPSYEEDLCKEKYPGRLLIEQATDSGDAASELPGTAVKLDSGLSKRRGSR